MSHPSRSEACSPQPSDLLERGDRWLAESVTAFVTAGEKLAARLAMMGGPERILVVLGGDFYHIDASNYEKNLEKALWLGNSSVDALYRQKNADGVYNRLLQYSLV